MKPLLSSRKSTIGSLFATLGLILMASVVATAGFITDGTSNVFADGSVKRTGFDPILAASENGQRVSVTGSVNCTAGEKVQILVRVSQRATGAEAEGSWRGECLGHMQTWGTDAVARGAAKFESGAAQGAALGFTAENGKTTDALQWLDNVTLVVGQ